MAKNDRVNLRFHTKRLKELCDKLKDDQKAFVRRHGFSHFLNLSVFTVPIPLLEWLMTHYQLGVHELQYGDKRIRLNRAMMQQLFGFICGTVPVTIENVPAGLVEEAKACHAQYKNGCSKPFIDRAIELCANEHDECAFMRHFMMVALATIICPNTEDKVDLKLLSFLMRPDEIRNYDWATYAVDIMEKEIKRFYQWINHTDPVQQRRAHTYGSCLPLLVVIYMDFLDLNTDFSNGHKIKYDLPRLCYVQTEDFQKVVEADYVRFPASERMQFGVVSLRELSSTPYSRGLDVIAPDAVLDIAHDGLMDIAHDALLDIADADKDSEARREVVVAENFADNEDRDTSLHNDEETLKVPVPQFDVPTSMETIVHQSYEKLFFGVTSIMASQSSSSCSRESLSQLLSSSLSTLASSILKSQISAAEQDKSAPLVIDDHNIEKTIMDEQHPSDSHANNMTSQIKDLDEAPSLQKDNGSANENTQQGHVEHDCVDSLKKDVANKRAGPPTPNQQYKRRKKDGHDPPIDQSNDEAINTYEVFEKRYHDMGDKLSKLLRHSEQSSQILRDAMQKLLNVATTLGLPSIEDHEDNSVNVLALKISDIVKEFKKLPKVTDGISSDCQNDVPITCDSDNELYDSCSEEPSNNVGAGDIKTMTEFCGMEVEEYSSGLTKLTEQNNQSVQVLQGSFDDLCNVLRCFGCKIVRGPKTKSVCNYAMKLSAIADEFQKVLYVKTPSDKNEKSRDDTSSVDDCNLSGSVRENPSCAAFPQQDEEVLVPANLSQKITFNIASNSGGDMDVGHHNGSLENQDIYKEEPVQENIGLGNPKKKQLLILDVNGLLVDINRDFKNTRHSIGKWNNQLVFKRPYCDDFIKFCFNNFVVGVWSSRRSHNLDFVLKLLLDEEQRKSLLFIWDQSWCTDTKLKTPENKEKPLFLKELEKVWREHKDFSPSNTLLVDDSPSKALRNPPFTAIFPWPYRFKSDEEDLALGPRGTIRLYLESLAFANADDVREFVKDHPFGGQRAITESDPNWKFYKQVLQLEKAK